MTPATKKLVRNLEALGVTFAEDGGRLILRDPRGVVDDAVLVNVVAAEADILALLIRRDLAKALAFVGYCPEGERETPPPGLVN